MSLALKMKKPVSELWFQFLGYAALTGVVQIAALSTENVVVLLAAIASYCFLGWWSADTAGMRVVSIIEQRIDRIHFENRWTKLLVAMLLVIPIMSLVLYIVVMVSTEVVGAFGVSGLEN